MRRGLLRLLCSVIMGEAEPSYPTVTADWQTRHGRRHRLYCLGNTRSIVPPGQSNASASAISRWTSTYRNECEGRWTSIWRPRASYTCRPRTTLRRASKLSLGEGSGCYAGGVQDPMRGPGPRGGPDSLGGPEPWLLALERLSKAWDTWRSQTFPGRGTGPDLCREDRTSDRRGPAVWL